MASPRPRRTRCTASAWKRARTNLDPRGLQRILRGREQDEADYRELTQARADFIRRVDQQLAGFDAVLMPTTPIIAPTFAELESDEAYGRLNLLVLRNPSIANFLDRCAISIPCHRAGGAPVDSR